jgi:PAS domain-containing protein
MPSKAISFCNSAWFEMLGIAPVPVSQLDSSWTNGILEQDLPMLRDSVQQILTTHEPQTTQFRFRRMFVSGDGHRYQSWGSSVSHPELDEHGAVKAIMTVRKARVQIATDQEPPDGSSTVVCTLNLLLIETC